MEDPPAPRGVLLASRDGPRPRVVRVSRPDWDTYYLSIAREVATRADCTRARHGAVIVDTDHRPVSFGYNGAPSGHPGCLEGACPRGRLTPEQLWQTNFSQPTAV